MHPTEPHLLNVQLRLGVHCINFGGDLIGIEILLYREETIDRWNSLRRIKGHVLGHKMNHHLCVDRSVITTTYALYGADENIALRPI